VVQAGGAGVTISPMGRSNQGLVSAAQPAGCVFRLKNLTGAYTPYSPNGANYPNVRLATPIQVRVSLDGGSTWTVRFQGEASSWAPGWDAQGKFAYVAVSASGRTRRLGMGNKPILDVLTRYHVRNGAMAVWPFDDGQGASQAANAVTGGSPMQLGSVAVTFGVDLASQATVAPALSTCVSMHAAPAGADVFTGSVNGSLSGLLHIDLWRLQEPEPDASETQLVVVDLSGGSVTLASIEIRARMSQTSPAIVAGYVVRVPGGAVLDSAVGTGSPGSAVSPFDLNFHNVYVKLQQVSSDVQATLYVDGAVADSHTFTSTTMPTSVSTVHVRNSIVAGSGIGNFDRQSILALNGTSAGAPSYGISTGLYDGETVNNRLTRLCSEEGIPLTIVGTPNASMGRQGADTFLNLVRECESTDLGYLLDGLGPGLTYVARSNLYSESAAVAIDANNGQIPASPGPRPIEDDQRLVNRVTLTRTNGSSVVLEDTSGPLGTAALGVYDSRYVVNTYADGQLADIARWLVHLGTVDGMRFPQIQLDLVAAPEVATAWLASIPTSRIDVTNLSNRLPQVPGGAISLLMEGWTEFLSATAWRVTVNCSPFRPWEVFTIQDSRLGRIETDGSTLNSSATTTATSLSVASSGGLWDTGSAPFDIDLEGEQVTVTAVTGSSSPQTFTVTRSVNGVVKAHNSAVAVKLWKPGVIAL
jgi:hypothetical protein